MTLQSEMVELQEVGFTGEEIGEWAANERKKLSQVGFSEVEIDAEFGQKELDGKKLSKQFTESFEKAQQPEAEGGELRPVTNFDDAFFAGFGFSASSLAVKKPETILSEDAPRSSRIASNIGTLAGDFPFMAIGALAGAGIGGIPGAVIGMGAAFALPEAFRATLMDAYEKGEFTNFSEAWDRISGIFLDTAKAWVTGAATGGVGGKVGQVLQKSSPALASPVVRESLKTASEISTMVTVGSALEGHVPDADEFIDAAIVIGGLKGATRVAEKGRNLYLKTGIRSRDYIADAQKDVTITQDMASKNIEVPRAYQKIVGETKPETKVEPTKQVPEPETTGKLESAKKGILGKLNIGGGTKKDPLTVERLYTMVFSDLNPIRQAVKDATGKKGLKVSEDPAKLAQLLRGAPGKADQMLEFSTFDFKTLKNNGKSLKQVLGPVRENLNDFRAYITSKRAIELEGRDIKSGLDIEQAKQVVKGDAKFEPILRELVDYQNRVAAYLRDSGVLSTESYNLMLKANKDYVPFYRMIEEGTGLGKGLTVRNPIKAIKGSERDVIDPLESIIKNTYLYTTMAERNAVGVKFIKMANDSGRSQDFIKKVKTEIKGTQIEEAEMTRFLEQHGIKNPPAELLTVFRAIRSPLAENEIAVFENGKRTVYEVEPDVAAAFKAADNESAGLLIKILSVPAKTLRAGSVLSPDFMIRNFVRDQSSAFVISKAGYRMGIDFVKGMLSIAKKDGDFQNWLKSGGANAALVAIDRQYLKENVFNLAGKTGLTSRAWNVAKTPLEILRIASELIENSTRVGEFKRSVRDKTSKAAIQEAGFSSREVTLDFSRIGSKMRSLNMISAFLNAHLQGVDRVARAIGGRPVATMAKIGASITLPSILLWMENKDDIRWKGLNRWEKDLFWIVLTDDTIWRIPKPFELGVIFGSVPERILEAYYAVNPDAFKDMAQSIHQAFTPNMMPTFAAPIIEQFANRSLFTDKPLIPHSLEKMMPEYQYNDYTTETTKALGALIGAFPGMKKESISENDIFTGGVARALTTPILMENYLRAWTGGLGTYALKIADKALREAGVVPDPVKPASTLADVPVVKAFIIRYPSASNQHIQDFYDAYAERVRTNTTFMSKAEEGDVEATQKVLEFDNEALIRFDGIKDTLTEHSKLIRLVTKDPESTPEDKRQIIDTLYFRMIEIAKLANEDLKAMNKGN